MVLPNVGIRYCSAGPAEGAQPSYIIPPDTSVQTVVMADNIQRSCSLTVSSDNDTFVRGVMLFAEQVTAASVISWNCILLQRIVCTQVCAQCCV